MKMFRFELRKLWRQKKLLWLLLIVLLCTCGVFLQNVSQQSMKSERALKKIEPFIEETDILYKNLKMLEGENGLDDSQAKQLEHVNGMANALFHWKSAIYNEQWNDIPTSEHDFLTNLQEFEKYGDGFGALLGIEKEHAIQKNDWLRSHHLSYEDEAFSLSPALFVKDSTAILLSAAGIVVLLLFFGTTLTMEQEQHTWLTLKTQPIAKWKRIVGKYISLLFVMLSFLVIVAGIGWIIPLTFGHQTMNLQYPQIVITGETFTIISTAHYLIRGVMLFICATAFVFSLIILVSTWVKSSFSALMLTGFILMLGFFVTNTNALLQLPLNPFQYFQFSRVLGGVPQSTDWLYPLFSFFWSCMLVLLAVISTERETGLFQPSEIKKPFYRGEMRNKIHQVWGMSIFEWRKMQRRGLLKQLLILLSLLIVIGYFFIAQQAHQKETAYIEDLQRTAEVNENQLLPWFEQDLSSSKEMKQIAEESGNDADAALYSVMVENWEQTIELFRETLAKNKAALSAYDKKDWLPFYDYQLHQNQVANSELNTGYFEGSLRRNLGHFTLDASIEEKKWLMENEIQPVFSGEYIPTIYHNWEDRVTEKNKWEEDNHKVDNSGLFSLYLYLSNYLYFVPIALFLFLVGAGFAGERGKKSTLQLLKTQPIAEKNLFLGKIIHASLTALLSCTGIFVFVALIGSIFNRFGDWSYPILHYNSKSLVESATYTGVKSFEGGFHFVPLGNYLVASIVLLLVALLFLIVLSIFLSLFISNQFGVFMTVLLVGTIGYIASSQLLFESAHLSPFTYLNIAKVTNGEVSTLANNPGINILTGSIVLLASTLFLIVVGYILLNRRSEK